MGSEKDVWSEAERAYHVYPQAGGGNKLIQQLVTRAEYPSPYAGSDNIRQVGQPAGDPYFPHAGSDNRSVVASLKTEAVFPPTRGTTTWTMALNTNAS